jgi:ketosteroid isomerase-like protein
MIKPHRLISFAFAALAAGFVTCIAGGVKAQTDPAGSAPAEITQFIRQIDAAANEKDMQALMQLYSPNFSSSDGLTRQSLQAALESLWGRFGDLNYTTVLNSWERQENAIVTETTTTMTATQDLEGQRLNLTATVTARQQIVDGQILQQEILAEASQLTTGENPPTVSINLPEEVRTGREFAFDAVVEEPLGDRYLLGAAVEEPVTVDAYTNPAEFDLELLSAGGLFKVGRAPNLPDDRWISAVLVRDDGMTIISRRLRVVGPE